MTVTHLWSLFGDRIRTAPPSAASKQPRDRDGLISKEKYEGTRKAPRSHKGGKVTWGFWRRQSFQSCLFCCTRSERVPVCMSISRPWEQQEQWRREMDCHRSSCNTEVWRAKRRHVLKPACTQHAALHYSSNLSAPTAESSRWHRRRARKPFAVIFFDVWRHEWLLDCRRVFEQQWVMQEKRQRSESGGSFEFILFRLLSCSVSPILFLSVPSSSSRLILFSLTLCTAPHLSELH